MRLGAITAAAFVAIIQVAAADGRAPDRKPTRIPAEPLGIALQTLAKERGFQVVYVSGQVDHKETRGASGDLTVDEALARLLRGTGLMFRHIADNGVSIAPAGAGAPSAQTSPTARIAPGQGGRTTQKGKAARSFSGSFRMARVDRGASSGAAAIGTPGSVAATGAGVLQEVTVTADKVTEPLMDVPMSLTALTGAELERSASYRFEDYVGKVPGLTLINNGAAGNQLVIRGISTGINIVNTSVATYIDETPFTEAGAAAGASFVAPNLDTFDMQRIEVLKGPQGTLYGANALGGLLKFVTNAPDPSAFASTVETGLTSVTHGSVGFDAHAMVNMPLASDAALRLVGYDTYYPGFIDDPSRGLTGINGEHLSGGRAAALFEPSAAFSIRLNALYQVRSWGDWPDEDVNPDTLTPLHGSLVEENLIRQPGRLTTQLYNVTMNGDAGFAKVLSSTSYYSDNNQMIQDHSDAYGPLLTAVFGAPYGVAGQTEQWYVHAFTQEVRLSSPGDGPLQWLLGGYFTDQRGDEDEIYPPIDATTGKILYSDPLGLGGFLGLTSYREYAGFVNLDYHLSPQLDVSAGARYSRNSQTFHETAPGFFGGGYDFGTASSESVATYSTDARWHVTRESMLYARVATGFAPGGPNIAVPNQVVPSTYGSSKTIDYEVGLKSGLLRKRLTLQLSLFDIEWSKIQIAAVVAGFGTITNGGAARSKGVEWDFAYRPFGGLTLGLNGAYTDAYLTQPTPASVNGNVGERLPGSPLWETSANVDYERVLFGGYSGFAGLDWRFNSSRYADFQPVGMGPRQEMPSFGIADVRVGLETQAWSLQLYVKNIANEIAINYVQPETLVNGLGPQFATVLQPRTVGITLTESF